MLHPGEVDDWVAECPSLPGCAGRGRTKEEAIANVKDAIQGYIVALEKDNLPVPEDPWVRCSWPYELIYV